MTKKFHMNSIKSLRHGCAIDGNVAPEYFAWMSMKSRCLNKNNKKYHLYGGRGISVCDEWLKFEPFFAYVGRKPSPKHSLDRIDCNKGYEPGNVRWATILQQNRNRRTARKIIHEGKEIYLTEISEMTGIGYATICKRWRSGVRDFMEITKSLNTSKSRARKDFVPQELANQTAF